MKVPGFILIELLVSLLIASFLSIGMMNSLTMVFKTNEVMDSLMDISAGAMRMQQQLERDLSGVMIPPSLMATDTGVQKAPVPGDKPEQKTAASEPKKETVEPAKKNHLFFATQKDKNTEVLTFITTNPLASFWSDKAGQAQSRIVRVVYRLEPDKENAPLFRLMRQEGMDLDFQHYESGAKKQIKALEVASGIKAFALNFMVEDKSENKDKASSVTPKAPSTPGTPSAPATDGVEPKKTITYKTLDEWRGEEVKDQKADVKMPKIPRFVRLKLTLMDAKKKREENFEYIFSCPCDGEPFAKKELPQKNPAPAGKPGGIRQRLAQASNKPKTMPGGLLGQFTHSLGARA
jgi:type II secretory pathway pseudopilin PulG